MKESWQDFIQTDAGPVARSAIGSIDTTTLEKEGFIRIHHTGGVSTASGFFAFDALMQTKPSALEGLRLRHAKGAWVVHNLISHPLMQFIALGAMAVQRVAPQRAKKMFKLAIAVHEATVPKPLGIKQLTPRP